MSSDKADPDVIATCTINETVLYHFKAAGLGGIGRAPALAPGEAAVLMRAIGDWLPT